MITLSYRQAFLSTSITLLCVFLVLLIISTLRRNLHVKEPYQVWMWGIPVATGTVVGSCVWAALPMIAWFTYGDNRPPFYDYYDQIALGTGIAFGLHMLYQMGSGYLSKEKIVSDAWISCGLLFFIGIFILSDDLNHIRGNSPDAAVTAIVNSGYELKQRTIIQDPAYSMGKSETACETFIIKNREIILGILSVCPYSKGILGIVNSVLPMKRWWSAGGAVFSSEGLQESELRQYRVTQTE